MVIIPNKLMPWLKCELLIFTVLLATLSACSSSSPKDVNSLPIPDEITIDQPIDDPNTTETNYAECADFEDYCFRYVDVRDRAWEEDIVYLAQTFLRKHPKIADTYYFEVRNYLEDPGSYLVNENHQYDESLRQDFISDIYRLIECIPELSDVELRYETQRIVAQIGDGHSRVVWELQEFFPIMVQQLENAEEMAFYTLRVPNEHSDLIYTQLVAINGIQIKEIVDRLRIYVSSENCYWQDYMIWDCYLDSLLIQKEALQIVGVLDEDVDTADFTFSREDGSTTTVTLTAIAYESYEAADMCREDFLAKEIGSEKYRSEKYYWFEEMPDDRILYIRINRCYEESGYSFDSFCWDVTDVLNDLEEPQKLVVDLRGNVGGIYPMSGFFKFLNRLNEIDTNGVYVIIDHGAFSSCIGMIAQFQNKCPDIQLLGTPTGQPVNQWGNLKYYDAPNGKLRFSISKEFWMFAESSESNAIMPDILIYQTLTDYMQGVDTVLEYIKTENRRR